MVVGNVGADSVLLRRACLDERNDEISIRYNYAFTSGLECNTSEVVLYGSKDSGPFVRMRVNTFGNKVFVVPAENSRDWRFFVRLINVCDDDSVGSDTLSGDLLGPVGAKIDSVSIREEGVIIGWTGSTSDDLRKYAIYYDDEQSGLSTTLDSADRDETFYYENEDDVDAGSGSVTYTIAAFDSCKLSTGQLDRHSTVHLNLDAVDYCDRTVELSRTHYKGWGDAVLYDLVYRPEGATVWRSMKDFTNGQELAEDLSAFKIRFEIKVRARDLLTDATSSSNVILLDFRDEKSLDTLYVYSVNNYGTSIEIKWWCSTPEQVQKFNVQSVRDGLTADVRIVRTDIKRDNVLRLNNVLPGTKYFVEAYSKCNESLGTSNTGEVIGLEVTNSTDVTGKTFNASRHLLRSVRWNGYDTWTEGVEKYVVERKLNGDWEEVISTADSAYDDTEVIEELLDSGMCYRIKAIEKEGVVGFSGESLSNEACFSFDFHGDLPNAFVANKDGSSFFKVEVEGLDTSASFLQVYNRWGQLVYNDGIEWNGGVNNEVTKPCDVGVYYYILKTQLTNKQFYYSTGQIHLMR